MPVDPPRKRIAVISDVHGNVFALERVLEVIASEDVDVVVNLGDHLSGAVAPSRTADLLMAMSAVTVRGNHERQLLELAPEAMGASDRLAHDEISEAQREWLAALPVSAEVQPGVLAFHGSPTSDLEYLLETVTPQGARAATHDEVASRLNGFTDHSLLLCGHTHLPRSIRLDDGPLVVNPGSVGLPAYDDDTPLPHVMEAGTPHARFAIVDDRAGRWEVEFLAVEYDWEHAARLARAHGRPDASVALRTGRVAAG